MGRIRAFAFCAALLVHSMHMAAGAEMGVARPSAAEAADTSELAMQAFIWGYPLVRAAQIRHNLTRPTDPFAVRPASVSGAPINRLGHALELSTPATRQGVAPNNDTLYSVAWLDMEAGPFVLETPDFGARYYTFQMGQADSSTQASFGQRTHGSRLPPVFIQDARRRGPVPAGMIGVEASQRYLMIAGRVLVADPSELPIARQLQEQMRLRRWEDCAERKDALPPISRQQPLVAEGSSVPESLRFLEMLGNVLKDWRTAPEEVAMIDSFSRIGLSQQHGFRLAGLDPGTLEAIARGLKDGEATVREKTLSLGKRVAGWGINYSGAEFGTNYLLRAAVAMDQIYVLPTDEALYPNARTDEQGCELDGRNSYVLRFEKGNLPPVDAFWSVTMYHAKGLLVENAIERYSIGDRTGGLVRGEDGSLEIRLQHARPSDDSLSNWLPAPDGPFMLMMRLYRPQKRALTGEWSPPGIRRIDPAASPDGCRR